MANIRIDLNHAPLDGETVSFKAPCNASDITGLIIYYENDSGVTVSREFTLNDANVGDIGVVDNIFAEGAIVKVILDTDANNAFVQNPDTNTYLEGKFEAIEGKVDSASAKALSDANAYTDQKIAAIPTPDVSGQIATHNAAADAHADIRELVNGKETSGTASGLINRTTAVNTADTNYTTLMARGSSLNSAETTPAVNGAIAWTYE